VGKHKKGGRQPEKRGKTIPKKQVTKTPSKTSVGQSKSELVGGETGRGQKIRGKKKNENDPGPELLL